MREDHGSFLDRLRLKITTADMARLDYAYDLAKYGHRNQVRDSGTRYFDHVRSTAIILVDELGITDVEIIIAALLHDMLEDSFLLTPDRIKITFGERVAALVSAVTKPKKGDKRFTSDRERHEWYFEQLRVSSSEAKLLKLADRLQNMRTLGFCTPEKQIRKINETIEIYLPLIADIAEEYPDEAEYLSSQLEATLAELSAVLGIGRDEKEGACAQCVT